MACLGECMIELVERPDGLLSRGFGGDTLNTAVYLARLGVTVDYVTALGTDPFSDAMLLAWREEGIGIRMVARVEGRVPGLYLIQTDEAGERSFSYWRDSAPVRQLFDLPDAPDIETALARYGLIYLSGVTLSLFGDAGRERLFATLDRLRANGGRVAFDTNFRPRGWPSLHAARIAYASVLARSDIVLASMEDQAPLCDGHAVPEVAGRLRDAGITEFVIKLPAPGCVVHVGGREITVPTERVAAAVDTTAAGDSFAAAYLAARLAGAEPDAAAQSGHRLAGVVVCHRGAIIPRAAMPADVLVLAASEDA